MKARNSVLDSGERLLAPLMPWLFLSLRRAVGPTVCAIVVGALFFAVPQGVEILHGFSPAAHAGVVGSASGWIPLICFFITAILLSVTVWYSARLLSAVEVKHAVPTALQRGIGKARLDFATTWYPRALGTACLALAMGTLIYATLIPERTQLPPLLLALWLIAAPTASCIAFLAQHRKASLALGIAALAGFALLMTAEVRPLAKLWLATAAVLPAMLLHGLVLRRLFMNSLSRFKLPAEPAVRSVGDTLTTLLVLFLISAAGLNILTQMGRTTARDVGTASAVMLFLIAALFAVTIVQVLLRALARQVTGLSTALSLLVALIVAVFGSESLGEERLRPADIKATAAPAPAEDGRKFFVNAYGGGLRAAIYTAEVLAYADDMSCGKFGEQVRAFSGVSGGSLGIATYLSARQQLDRGKAWGNCQFDGKPKPTPLTDVVHRSLAQDHLSPAMARMLGHDVPRFWSRPIRGQALLLSWHEALAGSLAEAGVTAPAGLAARLSELDGGMARKPTVFFNTTIADTGEVLPLSNEDRALSPMTVGQAVLHSARFPIVTPAGVATWKHEYRLVDGGYADNSGTLSLGQAFSASSVSAPLAGRILLNINGNLAEKPHKSAVPTALVGLLRSREARAEDAVRDFRNDTGIREIKLTYQLDSNPGASKEQQVAEAAPLGWYIGAAAINFLAESARERVDTLICSGQPRSCEPSVWARSDGPLRQARR